MDGKSWFELGVSCLGKEQYKDAESCFRRSLDSFPSSIEALLNLGYVLDKQGQVAAALECYESVLKEAPDNSKARYNRAAHLLRSGDLINGFADYEYRFKANTGTDHRCYTQARWDGSPLRGRSILVYCEQGLGDAIMFVRYLPFLTKMGATVILEAQSPLVALLCRIDGVARTVEKSDYPPVADFYIPLISLPYMFHTSLDSIPDRIPYLKPADELVSIWRERIGSELDFLKIGLVWAGKRLPYPNRSCPPELLNPLFLLSRVQFYSLQVGEYDRLPLPESFSVKVFDVAPLIRDFADTAALMLNLDLIITIDTAVAHLAGALGKEVWVMLPHLSDWRWMSDRNDSPWYPTMRLFRQPQAGDWTSVVEQVAKELAALVTKATQSGKFNTDIDEIHIQSIQYAPADEGDTEAINTLAELSEAIDTGSFDALHLLGVLCHQTGDSEQALELISRAVQIDATQPSALNNLGEVCRALHRFEEAEKYFRRALSLKPDFAEVHNNLGNALVERGMLHAARNEYNKAVTIKPDYAEAFTNLGNILLDLELPLEAQKACQQALILKPDSAEAHNNRGNVLLELAQAEEAERCYRQALQIKPDYAEAWCNLGNVLMELGLTEPALQAYRTALSFRPEYAETYFNLGTALRDLGRFDEAEQTFRRALAINPDYAAVQWNLSLVRLLQGDYDEGFRIYESRFIGGNRKTFAKMNLFLEQLHEYPRWEGESLVGKTLLIIVEQGLGDALMMMRYLQLLKKRGLGRLIVFCEKPLQRLFQSLPAVDDVFVMTDPLPFGRFDCYCAMMSLPHLFRTDLATIPNDVPYLVVPEHLKQHWHQRMHDISGLKVGLAWAGKKSYGKNSIRSMVLRQFNPLQAVEGIQLISLQKGEDAAQLQESDGNILDWMDECGDLLDTAALIEQLDLVITVDTAVAHLAGALGKPVWLLCRFESEWRWLLERNDSPWYPSMKIFRQSCPGDWEAVISRVTKELKELLAQHKDLRGTFDIQPETMFTAAMELMASGNFAQAIMRFNELLTPLAEEPALWYNLGRAYHHEGAHSDAEKCYRRTLELHHESPAALFYLGCLCFVRSDYADAEKCLRRADELKPDSIEILTKLGAVYDAQKKLSDAILCCRRILALEPGNATIIYILSLLELRSGNYPDGFAHFECRLSREQNRQSQRSCSQPVWDGSPLAGKSILVFGEQGMGDVIQFSRYLPQVAERGGKIIFEIDAPLVPLFSSFPGIHQVIAKAKNAPVTDVHIQSLSLPHIFGTTLENIPRDVPYLTPDPLKVDYWNQVMSGDSQARIGLVWRGNPHNLVDRERSCTFGDFLSFLDISGFSFYSLQVASNSDDNGKSEPRLRDFTDKLVDFSDTAALISNLDLVIAVDTAVAHLAGALGKPVWMLLPFVADWRWMENRDDSPWYPTMRLFRQENHGEWRPVIEKVKVELEQWRVTEQTSEIEHFDVETCYTLGSQRKEQGDLAGAERCFRLIVSHDPRLPDPHYSLGVVLQLQGKLQDAICHYRNAITLDPGFVQAHYNLGYSLWRSAAYQEAISSFHATIWCQPDHADAHWILGMLLLMAGHTADGWREYEWRWLAKGFRSKAPHFRQPLWDGAPLAGKTLLLLMEQGRGDMIQFIRFASSIAVGGKVIVCAVKDLVPLIATVEGVSMALDREGPLPDFDVHLPVMSIPHILGIPANKFSLKIPYLQTDSEKNAAWAKKLGGDKSLKIGLVWAGNEYPDPSRSCPPHFLEPLLIVQGTRFYSLQVGASERFRLPDELKGYVIDLADSLHDFIDTAAIIDNLDLVISIDTAVAHLAGALGKPAWTMLPFVPDWRWMTNSDDTLWYPTMRLFRQESPGGWDTVLDRISQELLTLCAGAEVQNTRGLELLQAGIPLLADASFRRALTLDPAYLDAHINLGASLDSQGRNNEAVECYCTALAINPDSFSALYNMGNSLRSLGRHDEAYSCYERTTLLQPTFVPAYLCMGEILMSQQNHSKARLVFEQALTINPGCPDAWQGVAEICQAREEYAAAINAYRRALALEPRRVAALNMLGTVYHCQGMLDEAETCYRQALTQAPDKLSVLNNLGSVLNAQERFEEAINVFKRLLAIDPQNADGHWNLALALLALGQYTEGWREYNWRFYKANPVPLRNYPQPLWDGMPLQGKTILLHCEQGFGDTLQFARYAPLVAQSGGRVVLECQVPHLLRLLQSLKGDIEVVAAGRALPHFDCHLPLLSLPGLFGTTLETIPAAVPYLSAPSETVEAWRDRLGTAESFRIGLVWCGRQSLVLNRKRSCPLRSFAPLAAIPNVSFYSLQVGEGVEQIAECRDLFSLIDVTDELIDFADTAALMANLDLVITIDTAVAHLAGAIGVPTWTLLPFGADWRWLYNRQDSPWYPTMRLFRQEVPGAWQGVMDSVGIVLADRVLKSEPRNELCIFLEKGLATQEISTLSKKPPMRIGIAWSCRQDNPITLNRVCPFSALAPLFEVPNTIIFRLQLDVQDTDVENEHRLINLTGDIQNFEDTAALIANLDLVLSIDTSVAHVAAATGRPTWVLLPHVPEWRWQQGREVTPWYPGMRLFRQDDFGDWDSVIRTIIHQLLLMHGNGTGIESVTTSCISHSGNSDERLRLTRILEQKMVVLACEPDTPDSLLDVGAALSLLGRFEDAAEYFRKALFLDPENTTGHINLAYTLLALGAYREGWRHLEWRLRRIPSDQLPPWPLLRPELMGNLPRGTSVLVHCEQGFGDSILFARFIPLLAGAGFRVIVSCQPPLVSLITSINSVSRVIPHGELLPVCDFQTLLLSLPYLLSTQLNSLPAEIPYLRVNNDLVKLWESRITTVHASK